MSLLPYALTELPLFNKLSIVMIDFVVFLLLYAVTNHRRLRDDKSKIFTLMGIFMLLWVNFSYFARLVGDGDLIFAEFVLRIAWIATPPLFYCTYLTSIYILGYVGRHSKVSLYLFGLTVLLSLMVGVGDLVISGITFEDSVVDIQYGLGFFPFLGAIFVIMFFTILPLLKTRINASQRVFLAGVVIFYVANLIFNIGLPVFLGITHLYYFGDYSTVFLLGFTSYAIVRHRLFDIRIIATELLTVVLWAVLFFKIFTAQSSSERVIDMFVFGLTIVFGIFLIRSVMKEVKNRQELEELNYKLNILDQRKNEFISVAAHELRAPLTVIKGYASMILEGDTGKISEKAEEFLQDLALSTERMIRLVNNMLDVSRIEEGRIVYQEEVISLGQILQKVYKEFTPEAKRKNLQFNLEIPYHLQDSVLVDADRLREVIVNFLSNALKYTEQGGVRLAISNPRSGWVRVEVIDTGMGITKEEQEKLFRKFYRVRSNVGKTIGSGLGLYISKLLIQKFGGLIGLVSEYGKGSNFWFELPLKFEKPTDTITMDKING